MEKISVHLYGGKGLFGGKETPLRAETIYCDRAASCLLYKSGKCLNVSAPFAVIRCKFGKIEVANGYTSRKERFNKMDAEKIREKIVNREYEAKVPYPTQGKFSENHIFDEEKSVRWNREEVARRNAAIDAQKKLYREAKAKGLEEFSEDVIAHLLECYSLRDKREVAEKIYSKAYADGHSGGLHEVFNQARDLADFVSEILELMK